MTVKPVLEVLLGGLIATLLTIYASRRQEKTKVSLKVLDEFLQEYEELAFALYFLANPELLEGNDENINLVKAVGDWFEIIATLYFSGMLNQKLVDAIGIRKQAQSFYRVTSTVSEATPHLPDLKKAVAAWNRLEDFSQEPERSFLWRLRRMSL